MAVRGNASGSMASPTSASARPVTPPPHGFSRGCEASKIATRAPLRARQRATHAPAGPAPTTATSYFILVINYTAMVDVDTGLFTVAVFQDAAWAGKALEALKRAAFPAEALSIIAKDAPDAASLVRSAFGVDGDRLDVAPLGTLLGRGRLIEALQGPSRDLPRLGIAATIRRVGFQPHDGR